MDTITLHKVATGWVAKHSNPEIARLFGSDTIPTAFTESCPADKVLREITRLNPTATISLA